MPPAYATSVTGRSEANVSMVASTRAAPSLVSVVPYSCSQVPIQPYNSSAMYEDTMLPMYVDYIGSIMPILDRQSVMTNWPPTPHPATDEVRLIPYNTSNLPTVPYLYTVGRSRLLPQPIQGVPALSDVTPIATVEPTGESVSQVGITSVSANPPTNTLPYVTFPLSIQGTSQTNTQKELRPSIPPSKQSFVPPAKTSTIKESEFAGTSEMEQTIPYVDITQ